MYSSGNEIVDKMQSFNATGNVIPPQWFKTIRKENGKPNLKAIVILSDIVYWYKPRFERSESTGLISGVVKKFKSDLLQRNYQQLAEQFGMSKREATDAVVDLEKLGVIKRHFRTVTIGDLKIGNVLFIELVPERLFELTYGQQGSEYQPPTPDEDSYNENARPLSPKNVIAPTQKRETNTKITTEITTENIEREYRERQKPQEGNSLSQSLSRKEYNLDCFNPDFATPEQAELRERYFNRFWQAYPRRANKLKARMAWQVLPCDTELYERILQSVELYKQSKQWQDACFIPYPETYLQNEKWDDDIPIGGGDEEMPF